MISCTRCGGSGFINVDDDTFAEMLDKDGPYELKDHLDELAAIRESTRGVAATWPHPVLTVWPATTQRSASATAVEMEMTGTERRVNMTATTLMNPEPRTASDEPPR